MPTRWLPPRRPRRRHASRRAQQSRRARRRERPGREARREDLDPLLGIAERRVGAGDGHRRDAKLAEDRLAKPEQPAPARPDEHDVFDDVPGPLDREGERPGREGVDVLAGLVAVVADRPLDQPIDERKRGHRRHVDEQPSAVRLQQRVQPQQEQVRRDEMLEQVRGRRCRSKRRPKSGRPSSTFASVASKPSARQKATFCSMASMPTLPGPKWTRCWPYPQPISSTALRSAPWASQTKRTARDGTK